jgi:hypothetical protein
METARFSETLAFTNQSTRRFNPKEHNQNHEKYFIATTNTFQKLYITKTVVYYVYKLRISQN